MMRAGGSLQNQIRISKNPFEEPEIPMDEALTIPFYKAFDAKKIVFDAKSIVFDTKRIVFDTKSIVFDKKKMQTAVGTVFPAIETIASTI